MLTPTQFQQRPANPPVEAPPAPPSQGGTFAPRHSTATAIQVLAQQVAALRAGARHGEPGRTTGVAAAARAGCLQSSSSSPRRIIDLVVHRAIRRGRDVPAGQQLQPGCRPKQTQRRPGHPVTFAPFSRSRCRSRLRSRRTLKGIDGRGAGSGGRDLLASRSPRAAVDAVASSGSPKGNAS